ncbi:molybdopterin biosynthesis protein MoeA [Gordonia effusa NBRC 100432]|uniref:Molybdopterin molybdenumtransferase n=1 Tax=Gordonia effusa NBRC 100432 TaxID=1077974 RepID=H0QYW9_9ACTN|nr:gephyrin-like molybdotransferase Glp [Gordonia effusa]GAB18020.1 molybdopterin biosynthesis protein MoeA [Gordonia effusa NBRC 100432]
MSRRDVSAHRAAIAHALSGLGGSELVPLHSAHGRVVVADVGALAPMPAFDNSAMDGFAVRAADVIVDEPLPVAARVYAGDTAPPTLPSGAAAAIMTGAPLPSGADAVVPVEQSREQAGAVSFRSAPDVGAFVRRTAADVAAGAVVVAGGSVLTPRHLAALAATGTGTVEVFRRPRVAVISTGSELVAPGDPLGFGQVYESNSVILSALCAAHGADLTYTGRAGDDGDFEQKLAAAAASADVVLTSGGVSMGEREPVRDLLSGVGWFGPIAMQPGGPQGLTFWQDTPVISLPGNPVSVMVSFEVLVRNALRAASGLPAVEPTSARLAADVTSVVGKAQFLRGRLQTDGTVEVIGGPGSHLVATAANATVLIEIDSAAEYLAAGQEVPTWPLTP